MKFVVQTESINQLAVDAVVVYQTAEGQFGSALVALDKLSAGYFSDLRNAGDLPKVGDIAVFSKVPNVVVPRVIVCTLSADNDNWWETAHTLWQRMSKTTWGKCALALQDMDSQLCRVFCSGIAHAAYRFDEFKKLSDAETLQKKQSDKIHLEWVCKKSEKTTCEKTLKWVQAWQKGSYLCRDLGNTPANVCTPTYLGEQAKILAKSHTNLTATVLNRQEIETLGMGALLGVAQGSKQEPRFIIMEYRPKNAHNQQPVVLVGKGVTFDAGGISLKPAADMDLMKYDMGGAATVLGTMCAVATAKLPVQVVGLIPTVENLPDGGAIKPGDIVTSLSGKTIEVLNTDAEGRLILCDALTYAKRYNPQAVIDIATLTGACVIALGSVRAGLFGNDDVLQDALLAAGEVVHDRVWKMPIDKAYRDMLHSPFADIANISNSREAGACTAAAFLSHFTEEYAWAHLDIAGVAWHSGKKRGGTGRPVALLFEYFTRLAQ